MVTPRGCLQPFRDAGGVLRRTSGRTACATLRIDKDRLTSDLYIADVGQDTQERSTSALVRAGPRRSTSARSRDATTAGTAARDGSRRPSTSVRSQRLRRLPTDRSGLHTSAPSGDLACSITGGVVCGRGDPRACRHALPRRLLRRLGAEPPAQPDDRHLQRTQGHHRPAPPRQRPSLSRASSTSARTRAARVYIVSSPASGFADRRDLQDRQRGHDRVRLPVRAPTRGDSAVHRQRRDRPLLDVQPGFDGDRRRVGAAVPVDDHAIAYEPYTGSGGSGKAFVTDNAAGNSTWTPRRAPTTRS